METNVKRPVQYADCSLNEGKTLDDAKVAERTAADLLASAGMKGWSKLHYSILRARRS